MDDNRPLRVLYTVFLGVLLALFVGVGIATFYEGPKSPDYPQEVSSPEAIDGPEYQNRVVEYDRQFEIYQNQLDSYNRNVSIISLVAAVVLIVAGLVFERRIKMLADAVMLGGIFTLLYSIGRGFAADDNRYVFMVLSVSLLLVFYLGYRRFVRTPSRAKKS